MLKAADVSDDIILAVLGMLVMADPTDESKRVCFIPLNLNHHQIRAMG